MTLAPTRRERLRATTVAEIQAAARAALVAEGPTGISLRAIAREMGLTAPALYRYYASRDDLITALIASLYDELSASMIAARDAAEPDIASRLMATSRAFRAWSVAHPAEFALIFGSPVPGYDAPVDGPTHEAGERFGGVWAGLFAELWTRAPFPVTPERDLDAALVAQLRRYADHLGMGLPLGAVLVFLECWARLYGLIAMEVFGQLQFALTDVEPMFEATLDEIGHRLGLKAG